MATPTNKQQFLEPGGMSDVGLWAFLGNVRVAKDGYRPLPPLQYFQPAGAALPQKSRVALFEELTVDGRPYFVVMYSVPATAPDVGLAQYMRILDESGDAVAQFTLFSREAIGSGVYADLNVFGEEWTEDKRFGSARLYDQLFIADGYTTYVVRKGAFPDNVRKANPVLADKISTNGNDALIYGELSWRVGSAASSLPYVTGRFAGSILCTHLNRVFHAGFAPGTKVTFHQAMSESQQRWLESTTESAIMSDTVVTIGPNTIVWSDAMDPYAINFQQFYSFSDMRGPITAMASHNNVLFVFGQDEVWMMTGDGNENEYGVETFTRRKIVDGIGASGKRSVCVTPAGVFYAHSSGIYVANYNPQDGYSNTKISEPLEYLRDGVNCQGEANIEALCGFNGINLWDVGSVEYNPVLEEVWFAVRRPQDIGYTMALIFQIGQKAWSLWTGVSGSADVRYKAYDIAGMQATSSGLYLMGQNRRGNTGAPPDLYWPWMLRVPNFGITQNRLDLASFGVIRFSAEQKSYMLSRDIMLSQETSVQFRGLDVLWGRGGSGTAKLLSAEALTSVSADSGDVCNWTLEACPAWIQSKDKLGTAKLDGTMQLRGNSPFVATLEGTSRTRWGRILLQLSYSTWHLLGVTALFQKSNRSDRG